MITLIITHKEAVENLSLEAYEAYKTKRLEEAGFDLSKPYTNKPYPERSLDAGRIYTQGD